jgi:hypothetical protein
MVLHSSFVPDLIRRLIVHLTKMPKNNNINYTKSSRSLRSNLCCCKYQLTVREGCQGRKVPHLHRAVR